MNILVFNESDRTDKLYKYFSDYEINFINNPEEYEVYKNKNVKSIITIVVDELTFFLNVDLEGLVYLKLSHKASLNNVFLYNIVNNNLCGIFVPNENDLYKLCDKKYFFLKNKRNIFGNFMVIDSTCQIKNEISNRIKSDLYNFSFLGKSNVETEILHPIKTFIINLEQDVHKKQHMLSLFETKPYHTLEFHKAIYGKTYIESPTFLTEERNYFRVTDTYLFQKKNPYQTSQLKLGEIGCALSHINAWKKIVDLAYSGAIDEREPICIFEDDIKLCFRYDQRLKVLLNTLKSENNWNVCFLGLTDDIPGLDFMKDEDFNEEVSIVKINSLAKRTHWGGTFGYLINYYGAQKLLACVNKYGICQAIDWFMFEMTCEVNTYKASPHLVTSELNFESNIQ